MLAGDDDLGEAERLAAIIRTLSDAEAATTMLPSFAAHLADDEGYG